MSEPVYMSELPKDIGGYQHLTENVASMVDDLMVRDGKPYAFVGIHNAGYGTHWIEHEQHVRVYRKLAVAKHVDDKPVLLAEPAMETKPTNPKDMVGSNKIPLHLWPTTASALGSLALLDGMLKYGRTNYRAIGVRSSIYFDAQERHMKAWFEGEDNDPDSGLPHLAHALACIAVLVDAQAAGKLNDDRVYPGRYREFINALTPHVARLKEKHKNNNPKHYTIATKE